MPYALQPRTSLAIVALYPVMHYLAVWLGLFFSSANQTATLWTSNALLFAVMVMLEKRWWLPLLASVVVAEILTIQFLSTHLPPDVAIVFSAANLLEALIATLLWQKIVKVPVSIFRLRDTIIFVSIAATVAPAISGLLGAFAQVGIDDAKDFFEFWQLWWAANALGILVFTSVILALTGVTRDGWRFLDSRGYELLALVLLVIALSALVFGSEPGGVGSVLGLPYVLYPLLIWGAMRFGVPVSATLVCLIAMIAVVNTDNGNGPFAIPSYSIYESVLSLQMFLVASSFSALIFGAAFSERRQALQVLSESQNKFSKAFHASPDPICICRISDGRMMDTNSSFNSVTGYARDEAIGATLRELNLLPLELQRKEFLRARQSG